MIKSAIITSGLLKPFKKIDGSLINAFEYFYTLYELGIPVQLQICNKNFNIFEFQNFLKLRYNCDFEALQNIVYVDSKPLKFALFVDRESLYTINSINSLKYAYLSCDSNPLIKYENNVAIINNKKVLLICESDFTTPKNFEINYTPTFRLDLMKPRVQIENKIFVNCPGKYLKLKSDKIQYQDLQVPNNFDYFNSMIYIQNPNCLDRKPRIFQECQYFGIPYKVYKMIFKDGAYYRLQMNYKQMDSNDFVISLFL